ncbi:MAG: DUF1801 domain-containing protein [Acidobacteria bacterium]|nr:DUF1801 domain-containing protein [Acidobacteriota bacterium]
MNEEILRFNGVVPHEPAIDHWFQQRSGPLGSIAQQWFQLMRNCGDEVRELMHDGCPTACLGDAPFAYVAVFTSHVNIGFFHGASLRDPARLLLGSGKRMRHIKLKPAHSIDEAAISDLIAAAWADIKARIENN